MSLCRVAFLTFFVASSLHAAEFRAATPSLRQLAQKAGYIFAGTVVEIRKIPSTGPYGVPTMQVRFRVEQAIRGVQRNQRVSIRESMGLWSDGDRYHLGESLLLFLYPKSKLGLTSPVAGDFGRFRIDARGSIVLEAARVNTFLRDPILKQSLSGIQPQRKATVRAQDFRRATLRAMEDER